MGIPQPIPAALNNVLSSCGPLPAKPLCSELRYADCHTVCLKLVMFLTKIHLEIFSVYRHPMRVIITTSIPEELAESSGQSTKLYGVSICECDTHGCNHPMKNTKNSENPTVSPGFLLVTIKSNEKFL